MTNLTQLCQRYEELGAEIRRFQEQEDAKNWPQVGDSYYTIDTYGYVCIVEADGEHEDKGALSIGNVFRSQEHAEKEREAQRVVAELRRQPGRKSFEVYQQNYCVATSAVNQEVKVSCRDDHLSDGFGCVYFNSKEACQAAISAVGEDRILAAARWLAVEKP